MNRWDVARSRADWKGWARMLAIDAANRARLPRGELPWERAHVHVEHHYRVRRTRDLDNLTAGLKGVLDGMKGILYRDDGADVLTLSSSVVIGAKDGIRIRVSPTVAASAGQGAEEAAEAVS